MYIGFVFPKTKKVLIPLSAKTYSSVTLPLLHVMPYQAGEQGSPVPHNVFNDQKVPLVELKRSIRATSVKVSFGYYQKPKTNPDPFIGDILKHRVFT